MTVDPRAALDRFVAALEAHFDAVTTRGDEDDARVDDAYEVLADAFDVYAEALGRAFNEALPFDLTDEEEDEEELAPVYDEDRVPDEAFLDDEEELEAEA